MKNLWLLPTCLMVVACTAPTPSLANPPVAEQQELMEARIVLGERAMLTNFPAICSFDSRCTCVLMGPEALLTAAHCVRRAPGRNTGKGTIMFFNPSGEREANCLVEPGLDLAVCRVDPVGNRTFERLSTLPLTRTSPLLLTGFGRTGTGAPPGRLHKGRPRIDFLPRPNSNLIRILMGEGASLDRGDSGGPAYLLLQEARGEAEERVPRLVAGINSNNLDVTSVSTPAASGFICNWAASNAPICGCPTAPRSGCRSVK